MEWLRNYQKRSKALKKTITLHAKLLDPHSSLKEVQAENLQRHRLVLLIQHLFFRNSYHKNQSGLHHEPKLFSFSK